MTGDKTYYDILGIPKTATDAEIKKSYRQLVRQHHPDVAQDKEAAKVAFIQIAEAYKTLMNPDRRLIYDTSIDTQRFRPQSGTKPGQSKTPETGRKTGVPTGASTGQRQNAQSRTQAQNAYSTRRAEVERWLKEARKAFASGQFRSAMYACKEAKRLDGRNAEAHVILGDVYRIQGLSDEAIAMYTIAVQLDPRNVDVQTKLDRLFRKAKVQTIETPEFEEQQSSLKIGITLIGFGIIGALLLFLNMQQGDRIPWLYEHFAFIGTWSVNLICVLFGCGVVAGVLLSVNSWVQHIDNELLFPSVGATGAKHVSYPVGLLLMFFSLFCFYFAVAIYLLIGTLHESISKSVLVSFAAAGILTAAGAVAFSHGSGQVLLLGGNIAFLSVLIGWGIGDLFRPGL